MTTNGPWLIAGLALLVGAGVGGWLTWRFARATHARQLRHGHDELQQRFAATIDQLRAAQVRAQTELEQARGAFKRQLASVAEEPRAATARAEERLRAAYAELDKLRNAAIPAVTAPAELTDGFAATRPMREGL